MRQRVKLAAVKCMRATNGKVLRYTRKQKAQSIVKVATYSVFMGAALLASGLEHDFAQQCVNELRAKGQIVNMLEE